MRYAGVHKDHHLAPAVLIRVGLGIAIAAVSVALLRPSASVGPGVVTGASTAKAFVVVVPTAAAVATPVPTTAPRPTSAGFDLILDDTELTKAATSAFPQTVSGVTVSDPQVRVQSTSVRLVAKAKVLFGTTEFVMTATPIVAAGRIAVRVESATLAGVSLPTDTRASIADTVQTAIGRLVPENVRVTAVTVVPGRITVQGTQP